MADEFIFDSDGLITFCSEFDNMSTEEITTSLLEVLLQDLNDRWVKLQNSYKTLCTDKVLRLNEKLVEAAHAKQSKCTKAFHFCKSRIIDHRKTLDVKTIDPIIETPPREDNFSHVSVPPCDTDIFYGGYEEWPSFRDMFTAVYIDNPRISPVQKLYYLRIKAQGQAGSIIRKYKLCADNFTLAWKALRDRYENQRILVENQIKALLNLPSVMFEDSASLQRLQTTINDCLSAIEAQKVPIVEWDPLIVVLCAGKLPTETLALWEQSLESHRTLVTWDEMDRFLSHRCEVVERLESRTSCLTSNNRKDEHVVKPNSSGSATVQYACKVCNGTHSLRYCSQFLGFDSQTKNKFVTNNKICLNCLSYSHLRKDCPSKFVCTYCQKNHHSLLHFSKTSPPDVNLQNSNNYRSQPILRNNSSPQTSTSHVSHAPHRLSPPSTSYAAHTSHVAHPPHRLSHPTTSYAAHTNNERSSHPANSHVVRTYNQSPAENVILPTAVVQIEHRGELFKARAFLDQGSEKTFISRKLQQQLQLPVESKHYQIHGFGGEPMMNSNLLCKFTLYSPIHDCHIPVQAIVVPKITRMLPSCYLSKSIIPSMDLKDIELADSQFYMPNHVDLLIGSNIFPQVILEGIRNLSQNLIAQRTIFGWIVSGSISVESTSSFSISVTETSDNTLSSQLRQFWEEEEIPFQPTLSKDDEFCQTLYEKTTFRNSEGRYVVRLPFKNKSSKEIGLGVSRSAAMAQYINLEQSLERKGDLANTYRNVLEEYINLNHMEPTNSSEIISLRGCQSFYLPHHAVLKPESRSTKVRVVFNASKKTSSGLSLNDILHVGPTLQSDLMSLILRWRLYKYVFNGDIEKMYRQIIVHNDDVQFQRILFREEFGNPVKDFTLKTVTFGVNCAPYLAIRTLIQLARDSQQIYPQAFKILTNETYVDDILSGAHDIQSAIQSLSQVISALKSAGFPLKKITSNCPEILKSVPNGDILDANFLKFKETSVTKTLGIQWNALSDSFSYTTISISPALTITKRKILSNVAKVFDPAGWISPIIIQAKIILQQLWIEGTNWDENVTPETLIKWNKFVNNISLLSTLNIPRWINFFPAVNTQIHGFCDASERAYCAAIYLRVHSENETKTHLFVSKTKVAPIKPVSLPRLELCGAVLLSKLLRQVINTFLSCNYEIFLWTDASIVLGWLQKPPNTWKTYIANRTAEIIENVGNVSWQHVRSHDNPADLGSRGCDTDQLINNTLWWHGPTWLQKSPEEWPRPIKVNDPPEGRKKIVTFHVAVDEDCKCEQINNDILDRFSKWDKAIRIMSYVFRFINATKNGSLSKKKPTNRPNTLDNIPIIDHHEFSNTKCKMIQITQQNYYQHEYFSLIKRQKIGKKSSLLPLNPYLDENGILRVNGRLSNSNIPFKEKYPIIIPVKSKYCTLFIDFVHELLIHAEINLMLRVIKGEYFIPRLKPAIRHCIRKCVICVRYRQNVKSQIMGALPADRSSFTLPFTCTGLDFAGPFSIKTSVLRNAPYHKGYVCVFVCFATKALHLELCSDLTTNSFLAAFSRFIGRRGLPKKLMSDNGTNFVGAERALRAEFEVFIKLAASDTVAKYVSHGFEWCFIPPNAPHMGGLWEAGVKSFKLHFRKVTQGTKYTFEEFSTLLIRIESVLNSRPLTPMSDDPDELLALTPGHFLRGAPLIALPEVPSESLTFYDRWEKLKVLHHRFSQRWKDEYLKDLQKRYKWQNLEENINVGQLVVIKDDLLPPNEWKLGRIMKLYHGNDGLIRVADLKTHTGLITRALPKLCILPITSNE